MEEAEFDKFAAEYRSLHAESIKASGESPEYFAEYKIVDLRRELAHLAATPAEVTDDTLLIHPEVLQEFFAFQNFLARADAAVRKAGLEGVIQIASFHPDYQFADTAPDDATNCTNRAPYPTLHLLREASIAEAVKSEAAAEGIYERNTEAVATGLVEVRKANPEAVVMVNNTPRSMPIGEVDVEREADAAREVRHHGERALEDAHEVNAVGIVALDVGGERLDAALDLVGGDEDGHEGSKLT